MKTNISTMWTWLSENGIDDLLDHSEKKRIRLLNKIIGINAVIAFIFIIIDICNLSFEAAIVSSITFFISIFLFLLIKNRLYGIAKSAILLFVVFFISFIAIISGKDSGVIIYFIPGALFPILIFQNKKVIIGISLSMIILLLMVFRITQVSEPILFSSEDDLSFSKISSLTGSTIITFLIIWHFKSTNSEYEEIIVDQNHSLKEYNNEIEKQKLKLEVKNKGVTDSINYANRIQQAILPNESKISNMLKNYFLLHIPKDIVSGDFYWVEKVKTKIYIAVADCTGHGVPGAMVSVVCNNALNRSIQEFKLSAPKDILNKARELVIDSFDNASQIINDGMDIALCCIDTTNNKLTFSGANNPLVIINKGELRILQPDRQPIGKYLFGKPFTQEEIILDNEDTLYLFSDGFVDQFGGIRGKKYKSKTLLNFLTTHSESTLDKQKGLLQKEFNNWKGDLEQIDDVCVVGFKI
jgi:serine phosphatase RsbU (regulator of sigma subunit)